MYTTTLAAPLGKGGKAAPPKKGPPFVLCQIRAFRATAAAGIYGGGGGLCSSAPFWASLALCQISDSEDPEKIFQKNCCSKLSEK